MCAESDHIFIFRFGFRVGENNMQTLYIGTLLSSNLYSCYSCYHRNLSSHKYLLVGYRTKNVT